jgi:copper(I)-binding protein
MIFALAGCGAGQISQTADEASAVNGYTGQIGSIEVRNASIAFAGQGKTDAVYRAGQSAPLNMTLVNVSPTDDKLVSVSSPVASGGQIQGDATVAGNRALQVGNGDAGSDASALSDRTISVTLTGLKQDITPGLTYPVVLTFARSGELTARLPVGYPTGSLSVRK